MRARVDVPVRLIKLIYIYILYIEEPHYKVLISISLNMQHIPLIYEHTTSPSIRTIYLWFSSILWLTTSMHVIFFSLYEYRATKFA
jgi:hypothetical protein